MAIYLDVIWLLNFLFDSLLLYLTAIILKRDIKLWRVLCGGLIGSIIILLAVTPYHIYTSHPISKLLFSCVMVLTVFGYKRLRYYLSGLMTFYFVTFLIGGVLIGSHYFIQFDFQLSTSVLLASVKGFGDPISWLFVLLGFPAAWHFSKKNVESMEITKIKYDEIVQVKFQIAGTEFSLKGLVDSGNQVYDPISRVPVMFVSINAMKATDIPKELIEIVDDSDSIIHGKVQLNDDWQYRMRIIPYKVMGKEHQLMIAIKPEELIIENKEGSFLVEKGLISFTRQQLSSDDAFSCIVHPKMLTGNKINEVKRGMVS
ncbi:sigma-E processing peptidase SpoIIGA [Niallia circulans]|uniref:Sigma-E processing peptidase SpoIIGA n=1 Tax=Niallia circulans TaxID=1397 RepID=A0A553SPA3_NIACI|nr:sigma-E processing peptidase SpoIIGA [Niallia circulans]TRZ38807.1 sigma-E processing peptidase SpoIIGA [Niallia circulans]